MTWRPSPGPYDALPPLDGDGGATSRGGRQQQQQQQQEQQQQQLHHPWERQHQQPRERRHLTSWLLALSIFFTCSSLYISTHLTGAYELYSGSGYNFREITNCLIYNGSTAAAAAAGINSFDSSSPRPPIHWNSSWMGNEWFPNELSGYKLYTPREIKQYFTNQSVLFIGDSTARRQFATWFAMIAAPNINDLSLQELTSESVIDVNKKSQTEKSQDGYGLSRHGPGGKRCDLAYSTCLSGLVPQLESDKLQNSYSQVVFVLGPWEIGRWDCYTKENGRRNSSEAFVSKLSELVKEYPNTKFIWRTWAGPGDRSGTGRGKGWKHAQAHNHFMKTLIHNFQQERYEAQDPSWTHISYIDWGQVMGPRSFPYEKRIAGDIDHHMGYEARSTFVQMWMNHMMELERLEKNNLPPAWMLLNSTDNADDCLHGGGSDMYCLSREELETEYKQFLTISVELSQAEKEEYERVQVDFCQNCTSSGGIDCGNRMIYFRGNHKLGKLDALVAVLGDPKCNKSRTVKN